MKFEEPRAFSESKTANILSPSYFSNKNRLDDPRLGMTNLGVLGGGCCTGLCGLSACHIILQSALEYRKDRIHHQSLSFQFI